MKKVLFASTALIATAGVAAADVTLSGMAEMGMSGGGGGIFDTFFTDIDVTFTMSGETDNGLTFGASIDLDESNVAAPFAGATQGGETIFMSGAFGRVTMGDTDGAFDFVMDEITVGAGSIADSQEHGAYSGLAGLDGTYDGQILRYDYSAGGFGVAVSAEIDDNDAVLADPILGLGFSYTFEFAGGSVDAGLGYQTGENDAATRSADVVGVSVVAALDSGLTAAFNWYDGNTDPNVNGTDETYIGLGLGYSFDAWSTHFNYARMEEGAVETTGYGLAVAYDLGGGANVSAGFGSSEVGGVTTQQWSFGVGMAF